MYYRWPKTVNKLLCWAKGSISYLRTAWPLHACFLKKHIFSSLECDNHPKYSCYDVRRRFEECSNSQLERGVTYTKLSTRKKTSFFFHDSSTTSPKHTPMSYVGRGLEFYVMQGMSPDYKKKQKTIQKRYCLMIRTRHPPRSPYFGRDWNY